MSNILVRGVRFLTGQERREQFERFRFAFGIKLCANFLESAFQDHARPTSIQNFVRRSFVICAQVVQLLGFELVSRDELYPATTFESMTPLLLVGQTDLQWTQEKTAEAPLLARHAPQCFVFEDVLKKRLSQVLRVLSVVGATAEIGVDRPPIDPAKFRQSRLRSRIGLGASGENDAPRGLFKTFVCLLPFCHVEHVAILRIDAKSCKLSGGKVLSGCDARELSTLVRFVMFLELVGA